MRSRKNMIWAGLLLTLALVAAASGSVFAYLSNQTGPVTATMMPATDADPSASINATTKEVAVNVGDPGYAVYVRTAVVVTWENGTNVYATAPTYTVTCGDNWFRQGDFYYYKLPISSGNTSALTVACTEEAPVGYTLHVEVISQTIQAQGTTDSGDVPAVTDAWGVTVENGQLKEP